MVHGEIEDSRVQAPVTPQPVTWTQLAISGAQQARCAHLRSGLIKGQVVTKVREADQDDYVLNSNGHLFTTIYRELGQDQPRFRFRP